MLSEHKTKSFALSLLLLSLVAVDCLAQYPAKDEVPFLPIYCQSRLAPEMLSPAEVAKWRKIFGEGFVSLHHYCFYVNYINRANLARSSEESEKLLNAALAGIEGYMAKEAAPSFPIRHIAYYNMGKVAARLGLTEKAIESFTSAIEAQPKYSAPYGALSDLYRESGFFEEALQTINQGLEYSPNSKGLLRRKKKLES